VTSERKISANHVNARASTGPKTAARSRPLDAKRPSPCVEPFGLFRSASVRGGGNAAAGDCRVRRQRGDPRPSAPNRRSADRSAPCAICPPSIPDADIGRTTGRTAGSPGEICDLGAGRAAQVRNTNRKRLNSYCAWIGMSGERRRDANLPFEPSIRRGGSGIAIIGRVVTNPFWQNEAKMINVFNGHCVQR
jgi:hypothetical protein